MTWSSTDASGCAGSNSWSGTQTANGTASITAPNSPGYYTYTLTCEINGTPAAASATLTVYGPLTPLTGTNNLVNPPIVSNWYVSNLYMPPPNYIVSVTANTVVAPVNNTAVNTNQYWNYWIGLQPAQANYGTINNGVLQPVVTFYSPYTHWTAISVYDNDVNPNGTLDIPIIQGFQSSYKDQIDGNDSFDSNHSFTVNTGDSIAMTMSLDTETQYWTVTTNDTTLNESNTLIVDLSGQQQNFADFDLEINNSMPVTYSPVFTNVVIKFAQPDTTGVCSDALGAANNYTMTPPRLDSTKTVCTIDQILIPHP